MTKGPVIIITGTPGTGKTTHAEFLVNESPIPLRNINVSEWVKERDLFEEYDQEWQSYTVDEDRVRFQSDLLHPSILMMKNH
jgi:adenylate kinase